MSDTSATVEKFRSVIVPTKLTAPAGKGKSFRVDTREGNALWIWPDRVHLLRLNEEYEVQGTVRDTYYNITAVRHLGPAPEDEEDYRPPPVPNGSKKMDYYRPRDPQERREIFVCALLGREIEWRGGRPAMTKQELIERGAVYANVWDALFGESE